MKNHAMQSLQEKNWSQVWNSEEGSSELRGGDLRVQKAMLLGSMQEVSDAWRFYCCIGIFHVYNGLLPFAVGSRVRFLGQLQLRVASSWLWKVPKWEKAEKLWRPWGTCCTVQNNEGQEGSELAQTVVPYFPAQHKKHLVFGFYIDLNSKLYRDAHIHSRYIDMPVLIVLKGSVQWPYHGEALN